MLVLAVSIQLKCIIDKINILLEYFSFEHEPVLPDEEHTKTLHVIKNDHNKCEFLISKGKAQIFRTLHYFVVTAS